MRIAIGNDRSALLPQTPNYSGLDGLIIHKLNPIAISDQKGITDDNIESALFALLGFSRENITPKAE
ncbi:hypothetical protein L8106_26247 [Lyngbya sp. PCC 8106]|nr:hypothetical protein L8106_26247 [Lyngbya sp. PCC 8106]